MLIEFGCQEENGGKEKMEAKRSVTGNGGLLRVSEASAMLGLKPCSLRTWVLKRKIPVVRLSARCIRIRPGDVEKIIREGLVPASPQAGQ